MLELCNYEYESDDDFPFEVKCSRDKGHAGNHHATLEFDWPTRPIDICHEVGHVWGEWKPIDKTPSFRADISDILLPALLGGKWKVTKEATVERYCDRCHSRESDAEGEWEVPPVSLLNSIPRTMIHPHAGEMKWVEDRLNPKDA